MRMRAPLFQSLLGRPADQDGVDLFPARFGDLGNVALQSGLIRNPAHGVTNEASEALGVHQVKGELLVAEAVQLFDDGRPQDELGPQPAGPLARLGMVTQIL